MMRPESILKRGTKILTHAKLGETEGMVVGASNLAQRRTKARGTIAGHRGDVYWVDHGDASADRAPYCFNEFEIVALAAARVESFAAPYALRWPGDWYASTREMLRANLEEVQARAKMRAP